jgi:16S rRNA (guanine1516-N2)-methyltransferase
LLGGDEDADSLLTAALRVAAKRVVVKRPDYAPCLAGMAPTMALKSKKHRYDVYIQAAMGENTAGE